MSETTTPQFRSTITHRANQMVPDDWHVQTWRLSDSKSVIRIFAWRWRAERWARSPRRLRRAFKRQEKREAEAGRKFTVDAA